MIKIETTQDGENLSVDITAEGYAEDIGCQAAATIYMLMEDIKETMPAAMPTLQKMLKQALTSTQNIESGANLS